MFSLLICEPVYAGDNRSQWSNICPSSKAEAYCNNVGKDAYEKDEKSPGLRGMRLGNIIGVTWKEKGTVVGIFGDKTKSAPEDAYYYIINDYFGDVFLQKCDEVTVK
jgi:hypothetical protein